MFGRMPEGMASLADAANAVAIPKQQQMATLDGVVAAEGEAPTCSQPDRQDWMNYEKFRVRSVPIQVQPVRETGMSFLYADRR